MKSLLPHKWITVVLTAIIAFGCKKEKVNETTAMLANSKWLLTKEILYFPTGQTIVNTRNSVFTFSGNSALTIYNPDSYVEYEKGHWSATEDKIITDINNDIYFQYQRTYKIVTKTGTF